MHGDANDSVVAASGTWTGQSSVYRQAHPPAATPAAPRRDARSASNEGGTQHGRGGTDGLVL